MTLERIGPILSRIANWPLRRGGTVVQVRPTVRDGQPDTEYLVLMEDGRRIWYWEDELSPYPNDE